MEGVLYIPPNRPNRRPDQICSECSRVFRPRRVGEGAEELCDTCYEAQFEPKRMRHWQRPGRNHAAH